VSKLETESSVSLEYRKTQTLRSLLSVKILTLPRIEKSFWEVSMIFLARCLALSLAFFISGGIIPPAELFVTPEANLPSSSTI
jgi:hypothetical protein